jgi:hypothetical protein
MSTDALSTTDRQSIVDCLHRYFWLVDRGRAAETAALFTQTARLTFGPGSPKPGSITGPDIARAMQARGAQTHITTRHVLSNIVVSPQSRGTVNVSSLLTLFRSDDDSRDTYPASIADVEDVFVLEGDSWLIQERTILPIFNRAPVSAYAKA